jgi:arylsulfatase A-like enzyme
MQNVEFPPPEPEPVAARRGRPASSLGRSDRVTGGRSLSLCLLLSGGLLVAGCGGGGGGGFRLEEAVGGADPAVALPGAKETAAVEVDDERRPAVVAPLAPWRWRGRVPPGALLSLGVARVPDGHAGGGTLEVQVDLVRGEEREALLVGRSAAPRWIDLVADLSRYGGEEVTLEVTPRLLGGAPGKGARLAWSRTFLAPPAPATPAAQPNVVLIVVDTLRADHLTPYGYRRATSPAIAADLAAPGVVVEQAFSQAPWTVPSVASFLTGRYPGEILSGPMAAYAIPDGAATLAERLAALGYRTASFSGNFILRDANGFGRGFATRYTPPAVVESNFLHADSVNARALPWLATHQGRPFFLYVHYMDPHDPYLSPDLVDGRSPFYPDYDGPLRGDSVHPLYMGHLTMTDPERDLAQLAALYDSEVAYADRAVGELIGSLRPEVVRNTLFAFTADHGEELYDHGGFKHGHTLYQEMIHVPLILRWDGHLPAGRRQAGTVELIDLVPTVMAAAGGEPDPALPGRDLLPALAGTAPLAPRAAFAQHLASGPLRAAAVYGGEKLILFNRAEPFAPADEHIAYHWRHDLGRMKRVELYDLAADPGERHDLAGERPARAAALAAVIHQHLDRALPGLRVMASGLAAGEHLSGRIVFAEPPADWHPYFLAAGDAVTLAGDELDFDWVGEGPAAPLAEKGVWVEGEVGGIRSVEARLGGEPLDAGRILLGAGDPYRGAPLAIAELASPSRPRAPAGPALRLWTRPRELAAAAGEVDEEVERSLRALGYVR